MTYPSVEANIDDLLREDDNDDTLPRREFRRGITDPTPGNPATETWPFWPFHENEAQKSNAFEIAETRDPSTPSSHLTHTPPPEQSAETWDSSAYYMPVMFMPEQGWDGGMMGVPSPEWGDVTCLMVRNLPNKYNQQALLRDINEAGFIGTYDFLYLPVDTETNANKGYAFINFSEPSFAWMFSQAYEGRKMPGSNSSKVVSVSPATLQGFDANYKHYSNTRVNRGNPANRPLFLREPRKQKSWQGSKSSGRRKQFAESQDLHQKLKSALQSVATEQQEQQEQRLCSQCGFCAKSSFKFCPECGSSLNPGGA